LRVNSEIRAESVRLIDEENNQIGVVPRYDAIGRAREAGMDLVEVSPSSEPPVCRIMDYGKWLYEQKRKDKEGRKKSHVHAATLKEIRLRPETDKHDIDTKLTKARGFLEKGHKVQITMLFRGRQMMHQEQAFEILKNITTEMELIAKVERPMTLSGKRLFLLLAPR